jgi:hypothetical protein
MTLADNLVGSNNLTPAWAAGGIFGFADVELKSRFLVVTELVSAINGKVFARMKKMRSEV